MDYITAKEAAEKWNTSLRTVQQLCVNGRIDGAAKIGTQWMIPRNAEKPVRAGKGKEIPLEAGIKNSAGGDFGYPMPLLNTAFTPGTAKEYAENFKNPDQRNIALAEYYYFSGNSKKAAELTKKYLQSDDIGLRLSAMWIYAYASLALDNITGTKTAMVSLKQLIRTLPENIPQETRALVTFIATAASVLLHLPLEYEMPPMGEFIGTLPAGLKLFALYVYAHYAYLQKAYVASAGIAETALALETKIYPIPAIYLHLVAVMDYVTLKQLDMAKKHIHAAWEIAHHDNLIEAFGEHHGLLCGMLEATIKKDYPEEFKQMISITYKFSAGWRKIHNPNTGNSVADTLTTTEFAVSMLASRDFTTKEIAAVMGISENTVKYHVNHAMAELGVSSRKELKQFMLN